MRAIVLVAAALLLVTVRPAKADNFLDIEGGITTPLGDDDWNDAVESSPMLALHIGAVPKTVGGMLSIDWTPYNTDLDGSIPNTDITAHRFRLLGNLAFMSPVKAKLMVTGRVGLGMDYQYYKSTTTVGNFSSETSDSDVGIAFEMGLGVWVKVGSIAVGGELAIPLSHHDEDNSSPSWDFVYTTYDLNVLLGVRLLGGSGD